MMLKRRELLGLIALPLVLTACGEDGKQGDAFSAQGKSSAPAAQKQEGIVIARPMDVVGLDPGFLTESAVVVDNIFDTLVTRDENMKLVPSLAESWSQTAPDKWVFKLRAGVKFTNGESMDAAAVKFSIDRVKDPEAAAPTVSYISTVKEVRVIDPLTVEVVTAGPDPLLPTRFSRYPTEVVPPKYVTEVGRKVFAQKPVGTGAYKLLAWEKGTGVTLERNDGYWGKAPQVSRVVFRAIPEASTRVNALLSGEADIITDVSADDRRKIESSEVARVSTVERAGNIVYIGLRSESAPLNDLRVRQALNYAVDKRSIVKYILKDAAVETNSIIGPRDFGYAGEPAGYAYDPEKAKALLAEAGYAQGFSIELDTVSWYLKSTDVAQAIAEQLKAIGVRVKINPIESAIYRERVPAGKESPLYMLGWSSTNTLDADAAVYAILHSGEPYSTYSNPTVDKLLEEARFAGPDTPRAKLYAEIQAAYIADAPRIFLYQENKYYGVSKRIAWEGRADTALPVKTIGFVK